MCRRVERNHEKVSEDCLSLGTGKRPIPTDPNAMVSTDVSITVKLSLGGDHAEARIIDSSLM
jgi:hypothetical protein